MPRWNKQPETSQPTEFFKAFDVTKYEGMIRKIARRFEWATRSGGLDEEDLLQAGRIGCMKAAEKYDTSRGTSFVTYSWAWVRAYIGQEANERCRTVRVNHHKAIADAKAGNPHPLSAASLDSAVEGEGGEAVYLTDLLGLATHQNHDGIDDNLVNEIKHIVGSMKEAQQQIVKWRFYDELTLAECGRRMGTSREWARLVEKEALRLLRSKLSCSVED